MKQILFLAAFLWLFVHCATLRRNNDENASRYSEGIPAWAMPEAAVTDLNVSQERAESNESVVIEASIANLGTGITSAMDIHFLVDGQEIDRQKREPLTALSDIKASTRWRAEGPGVHPVEVVISLDPSVFDANTTNNRRTAIVRVAGEEQPTPELEVNIPEDALRQCWMANENEELFLPVTFRNPSFAHIDNISFQFYLNGELLGQEQRTGYLAPGAEQRIQLRFNVPEPGEHCVSIKMNLPESFPERNLKSVKGWWLNIPHKTNLYDVFQKHKWVSIGPKKLENGDVGRITCFAYHPTTPNIMYAGGFGNPVATGVWKTTDGGKNWFPIGDKLPSMMVASIAVDPAEPANVYAGTVNNGIFKSTDDGNKWQLFAGPEVTGLYVNELIVRTEIPGISPRMVLYVASRAGVLRYKNDNPGIKVSNPNEWTKIKQGIVTDLAIHPTDRSILYASIEDKGGGLFCTKNAVYAKEESVFGNHDWDQLNTKPNNGLPQNLEGWNKLKLDIFQKDPLYIYAGVSNPKPGYSFALYRSINGGNNFDLLAEYLSESLKGIYNPFIRVHPTLSEMVYFGGVDLFKWSAYYPPPNKKSWTYRLQNNQADMKELIFSPVSPTNPNKPYEYYFSCDQGIYYCKSEIKPSNYKFNTSLVLGSAGDSYEPRNNDLRVTQIYDFDLSTKPPFKVLAGTQDDGTILYEGSEVWREVRGGDGYYSLIAPSNTNIMYSQYQYLSSTERSGDGGKNWVNIAKDKGLPPDLIADGYIMVDPNYPNTVLAAGSRMEDNKKEQQIFVTMDAQQGIQCTWDTKGPSGIAVKGSVRRIVIQPGTTHWFAGTTKGQIWTTSAKVQGSWSLIDAHPNEASIVSMAFSAADPNVLYVLFDDGDPHFRIQRLVYTPGGGWNGTWMTDNLDLTATGALRVICGDKFRSDVAYLGTDHGVFRWDGMKPTYDSWKAYNDGFPLTTVVDLKIGPDSRLYAATHGRGAWMVITGP